MNRVLVTGAAGLIGSATVQLLAGRGVPVTGLVLDHREHDLPVDRLVVGDAGDPAVVADAMRDVEAVIHLAAIPTPLDDPGTRVFAVNTQATFAVLDAAGQAGLRRAVIASSYAICGLPFAAHRLKIPYLPMDTALPLQITDPYALSKRVDEETAAMMHRRYGLTVVAMRLPFVGAAGGELPVVAERYAPAPPTGAHDGWSYLDVRDAGRALVAALDPAREGSHVLYVAAPETLVPFPTEQLLDRYHPGVPRPPFPGRTVPIDLAPARELIDFTVRHPWPLTTRDLMDQVT